MPEDFSYTVIGQLPNETALTGTLVISSPSADTNVVGSYAIEVDLSKVSYTANYTAANPAYINGTLTVSNSSSGGGGGTGGGYTPSPDPTPTPTPVDENFIFTPDLIKEMLVKKQGINIENGLQLQADLNAIPRNDADSILIKISQIKDATALSDFYQSYPTQQALYKGYEVNFTVESNGQTNSVMELLANITLKFKLTPEELKGINPDTLEVLKEDDNGVITKLNGTYDAATSTFIVTTDHLCKFYLMAQASGTIPVHRLWGSTAYDTALKIAKDTLNNLGKTKMDYIVLATGDNWKDSLTGSVLAGTLKTPLLITPANMNSLQTGKVLKFIEENAVPNATVYLLGGEAALGKGYETWAEKQGFTVKRLWGANAGETAIKIAEEIKRLTESGKEAHGDHEALNKVSGEVFIVTDTSYADALSVASIAIEK